VRIKFAEFGAGCTSVSLDRDFSALPDFRRMSSVALTPDCVPRELWESDEDIKFASPPLLHRAADKCRASFFSLRTKRPA
jgi:hypothetical protein